MRFFLFFATGLFLCTMVQAKPLRVALLPIPDALPFHVAESRGYFKEAGVSVQAIPVASALERDQLMQAGRIHGMINEMAGTAIFNRDGIRMQVLQIARKPMDASPLFRILARPGSSHTGPEDLKGVPTGISRHTIIEYLTDRMLQNAGLKEEDILKRSVPAIPERFQLLMQGRLEAAVMPDPLAFAAMDQGAVEIANDLSAPFYSASVLSFGTAIIRENRAKTQAFLSAWNRAAEDINQNPEAFRELFIQKVRTPPQVQKSYPIPPFPVAELPSQEQWQDMMNWMLGQGLVNQAMKYEDNMAFPEGITP
ncbi:NitT/TauT family transport system substrate-binding protein [Desulfobotulus alkaliphilus]|uniref:NitT/TauT family transport system substrate-binding protein n=1 Tax=Desulfobotulus alkaliphilus TaxID=622671 RepID=A0A562S8V1_9BACT|nr:ABC transporter substrate-binding protein [Desulfobotulus alkaliphilus]TWI76890.1 NitT/TauT family transport system substrate-binding protein [Desulfobotulus alkaliphilus]